MKLSLLGLVFLSGGLGSVVRFAANQWIGIPWSTAVVNVLGSFLIALVAFSAPIPETWRIALMAGFLGGLTTFSGFSMDSLRLIEAKAFGVFAAYLFVNVLLSVAACYAGSKFARFLA